VLVTAGAGPAEITLASRSSSEVDVVSDSDSGRSSDVTEAQPDVELVAGRYRLHSMIGRGGTGAVWRADDRRLGRPVAIKQILASEHRSMRSRARALREGQAVAKLRTPGVVQVYDVIDVGPYVYLVMELVSAPSLSRLVRRNGPLDPADAAATGRAILATLDAIHRAGVVHRDIKPSNILIDGDRPRLTDFGIALFGDGPMLTAAGSVLGTPAYMSPEQANGRRPGPEADLYGLGATLYFAVEGRAPFSDDGSWETAQAVRTRPHRPPARLGPLGPIVEALLDKDPQQRPSSDQVGAALAAVAGTSEQPSRPATTVATDDAATPAIVTSPPPAPSSRLPATAASAAPGLVSPDDEHRQTRKLALWVALLLALLAIALVLLFVAVRGQPADAAAAAVLCPAEPVRRVFRGTRIREVPHAIYHGRGVVWPGSRGCNKSTHCGRSSSPAQSSRRF
jgi:serine/threonine protein kinase